MEQYSKDLIFPFVVAGISTELMTRYVQVMDKLEALENKLKHNDPVFDLSRMWTVRCSRGRMIFYVTAVCKDKALKSELLAIFTGKGDQQHDMARYTLKKAPKLSASSYTICG